MREQTTRRKRGLPALWERLTRHRTGLTFSLVATLIFVVDIASRPEHQITARVYVALVQVYQAAAHPLLEGRIQCRYRPSCSEYSIQAVRRHGLVKGLWLTVSRLSRCTSGVPLDTYDPVPSGESGCEAEAHCNLRQPVEHSLAVTK